MKKRFIFRIKTTNNVDAFTVFEYGNNRTEAYEKVVKQYPESEIEYLGRKLFTDDILEKAKEYLGWN